MPSVMANSVLCGRLGPADKSSDVAAADDEVRTPIPALVLPGARGS